MLIGYMAILALTIIGAIIGLQFWLGPMFKNQKAFRWASTAAVIFVALILVGSGVWRLRGEIATRTWPVAEGTITEARVVGERAIHPEIDYIYSVNGREYSGVSSLRTPGFGNKRSRLETAELLVDQYQVGMPISVHYDPARPNISTLKIGITYSSTLETALGTILILGIFIVAIPLMRKNSPT
jgi:hypothetical protein